MSTSGRPWLSALLPILDTVSLMLSLYIGIWFMREKKSKLVGIECLLIFLFSLIKLVFDTYDIVHNDTSYNSIPYCRAQTIVTNTTGNMIFITTTEILHQLWTFLYNACHLRKVQLVQTTTYILIGVSVSGAVSLAQAVLILVFPEKNPVVMCNVEPLTPAAFLEVGFALFSTITGLVFAVWSALLYTIYWRQQQKHYADQYTKRRREPLGFYMRVLIMALAFLVTNVGVILYFLQPMPSLIILEDTNTTVIGAFGSIVPRVVGIYIFVIFGASLEFWQVSKPPSSVSSETPA